MKSYLFFLLIFYVTVFSYEIPQLKGHLNDSAGFFTDIQKENLENMILTIKEIRDINFIILTADGIKKQRIKEYADLVVDQWDLDENENYILIVITKDNGYVSLNNKFDIISDIFLNRLAKRKFLPYIKKGEYFNGTFLLINTIFNAVYGDNIIENVNIPPIGPRTRTGLLLSLILFLFIFNYALRNYLYITRYCVNTILIILLLLGFERNILILIPGGIILGYLITLKGLLKKELMFYLKYFTEFGGHFSNFGGFSGGNRI